MEIRVASKLDLDSIVEIEEESFSVPFKRDDILYELENNPFSKTLVIEDEDKKIYGYIIFWITFDSATINRIAVRKNKRNMGFAGFLLQNAEKMWKENDVEMVTLEVRASNIPAISLYEKYGFLKITVKKQYYEDGEDAIYMMKGLI